MLSKLLIARKRIRTVDINLCEKIFTISFGIKNEIKIQMKLKLPLRRKN